MMKIKACPICGNPVINTCYHEGEDWASVEMAPEKALELAQYTLDWFEDDVERYRYIVQELQERLDNG